MKNVIFNEDCNHFLFTRDKGGCKNITKQEAIDFVIQYKDTGINEIMFDIGAPLPWYDCKKVRSMLKTYKDFLARGGEPVAYADALLAFYESQGCDVQTVFFRAAKEAGLHPYISLRMSDVHEGFHKDSFLWSDFYRENRMKMNTVPHRTPAAYMEYCLNYHFEEVRDHMYSILEEALETFDADGVELDFLREAYLFGYGREHEGIPIMNAFMRRIHNLVKQAETRWGHPLKISVRMPDTPEKALRLGFDFFDWVDAGLIDRIVISSRWATTDTGMPVDLWKRVLKGKNVRLAAGLEILLRAHETAKPQPHSYETAVGTAAAFLSQGADEIYLFNFFDHYNGVSNFIYFGKDAALYRHFLTIVGDYEALIREPRRHVVSYNDMPAVGVPRAGQLPVKLVCDRSVPGPFDSNILYSRLRVVTGKIPAGRSVKIILGFEKNTAYAIEDLTVYLNQKPCRYVGTQDAKLPAPDDLDYPVFEAENDGTLPDVSVIELGLAHGNTQLSWAEIEIL